MTYLSGLTYLAFLPWLAAFVTALWFGWLAGRAGVTRTLWVCGGFCFALVTTTIVLGLSEAAFIPMSHDAVVHFQTKCVALTVALLVFFGWIFTASLHGHHLPLWRLVRRIFNKPAA
jgi:hypothetical protein